MENSILKKTCKYIIVFFSLLFLFIILIIGVDLIPKKYIEKNVEESSKILKIEGTYTAPKYSKKFILDNYTEAIMISIANSIDTSEPIKSSILMRRYYNPGYGQELVDYDGEDNPVEYLSQSIEKTNKTYAEYSRYWQGYLVYLRPLLVFLNYGQIRGILTAVIIMMSFSLIAVTYLKKDIFYASAITIILLISQFWYIGLSMDYSASFIIMLASSIYILLKGDKIKDVYIFFFVTGMVTAFFDFFTFPLITLGIPLIFYQMTHDDKSSLKDTIKIIINWGLGYGLLWGSKWIISDTICNAGTIRSALEKIFFWTAEKHDYSYMDVVIKNISYCRISLIVTIELAIMTSILNIKRIKEMKKMLIIYIVIAVLPFAWMFAIKNHSFSHARFTFRILFISMFAALCIIIENVKCIIQKIKYIQSAEDKK